MAFAFVPSDGYGDAGEDGFLPAYAEYNYMHSTLHATPRNQPLGAVTACAFDPLRELLWVGTSTVCQAVRLCHGR